jgi:hypothetical protein
MAPAWVNGSADRTVTVISVEGTLYSGKNQERPRPASDPSGADCRTVDPDEHAVPAMEHSATDPGFVPNL